MKHIHDTNLILYAFCFKVFLWFSNPWSICKRSSNALRGALQMRICYHPSHFWHYPSSCSLLYSKNVQYNLVCRNRNTSLHFIAKVDAPLHFVTPYHQNVSILGLTLFTLQYLVHQTCHHVFHRQFFHWHRLEGSDQVLIWGRHFLEQSHGDGFLPHGYLPIRELICKCFHLVNMVQQVVILLHIVNSLSRTSP